jgi:hypothetical protein
MVQFDPGLELHPVQTENAGIGACLDQQVHAASRVHPDFAGTGGAASG